MLQRDRSWQVEFTEQFEEWWTRLDEEEQEAIAAVVEILQERGPGSGDRSSAPSRRPGTRI